MKCLTPIFVNHIVAPCGKCYACRTNHRNSWDLRLRIESDISFSSFFLTLTYDDIHYDDKFHYDHIQRLLKNFRNNGLVFSYYCIGEAGTTTFRKHWHILLFVRSCNDVYDILSLLSNYWRFGFFDVGDCTPSSIHYVTKWHVQPKAVKGVVRCSKSLGLSFLDGLSDLPPSVRYRDYVYPAPRYFRKKLGLDMSDKAESVEDFLKRKFRLGDVYQANDVLRHIRKVYNNKLKNQSKHTKL